MSDTVASAARTCRVCGCTERRACDTFEGPCYWIGEDLCSGCDPARGGSEKWAQGGELVVPTEVTRVSGMRVQRLNNMKHLTEVDLVALAQVEPIVIEMNGEQAMALLTLLQLAARHRQLPQMSEPVTDALRVIGNALTNHMAKVSANVLEIAVAGWQEGSLHDLPITTETTERNLCK